MITSERRLAVRKKKNYFFPNTNPPPDASTRAPEMKDASDHFPLLYEIPE